MVRSRRAHGIAACAGTVLSLLAPAVAQAATITPSTFADDNANNGNCTLREAVISANGDAVDDACTAGTGADEIALSAGTYALSVPGVGEDAAATGDLDITDPDGLKISGDPAGSTVDAKGIDRVFHVLGDGSATLDPLTITGGNSASDGGGIAVEGNGIVNVVRSTISGNSTVNDAGGIDVGGPAAKANMTESTISGNAAAGGVGSDGGGLDVHGGGDADITNSTISGNQASPVDDGGGMRATGTGTVVNVTSSTIAGNASGEGGGLSDESVATLNVRGSIVADNTAAVTGPDCVGTVTSQGHNLIGSTTGCTFAAQGTDLTNVNPLLGPLADNGGPTQTHAPLAGSPAIEAGPPDAPPTDQRGVPRALFAPPDIGAYELATCLGAVVNRVGSAGDDSLSGTEGPDAFLLLAGNDTATGLGGNDAFCGAEGDDTFSGDAGDDLLEGAAGNDTLNGGDGDDLATGGDGDDQADGGAGNDTADGGAGNDNLKGSDGNDRLKGLDGNDRINGGNGKDKLKGGNGKDRLKGAKGKDHLNGGKGKDRCNGGQSRDRAKGCEKERQIQ